MINKNDIYSLAIGCLIGGLIGAGIVNNVIIGLISALFAFCLIYTILSVTETLIRGNKCQRK